jgi:cytochrome c-type biogenesis protein CcmF
VLGEALTLVALAAALAGTVLSLLAFIRRLAQGSSLAGGRGFASLTRDPVRLGRLSHLLASLVAILLAAMTFFMISRFMADDFSYLYVWSHSSSSLPWWYKLAGFWAGIAGSFLLWATLIAGAGLILGRLVPGADPLVLDAARATVFATLAAFLIMISLSEPWALTNPAMLFAFPKGLGLNVLLRSPWMLIHPPVLFTGYAFAVLPFGAALARVLRPGPATDAWTRVSMPFARISWCFLTAAVALGAHWAYYVIGWGGYWAWDPVETSSLLPWIAMTAFLHAQVMSQRKGLFARSAPLLAMLPFTLTLLATFVTRTGVWLSVHSFATLTNSDQSPIVRLAKSLGDSVALAVVLALLLGVSALVLLAAFRVLSPQGGRDWRRPLTFTVALSTVVAGAITWSVLQMGLVPRALGAAVGPALFAAAFLLVFAGATAAWALWTDEGDEDADSKGAVPEGGRPRSEPPLLSARFMTTRNLLLLGVLLFTTGLFLTVLMLVQAVNGYEKYSFDSRLAPGVLLLVAVLAGYMLSRRLRRAEAFFAVVIAAEVGVVLAVIFPLAWIAALIIPAAVLCLLALLVRTRADFALRDRRLRRAQLGSDLTHVGVVLVIIGYVASGYASGYDRFQLSEGARVQALGFELDLEDIRLEKDTGDPALRESWDTYVTVIGVLQGGTRLDTAQLTSTYEKIEVNGNTTYTRLVKANIWVVSTFAGDLYLILKANPADTSSTVVDVYFFPLMPLLWGGAVAMVAGMAARFLASPAREPEAERD